MATSAHPLPLPEVARLPMARPVAAGTTSQRRPSAADAWALLRFALAGAVASASYGVVFLVLATLTAAGAQLLNLVATVISTLVANELHRRFSFRGAPEGSLARGHGVGGANAVAGLVLSGLALAGWHHLAPHAGPVSDVLVVYAVNAAVGLVNFLVLRHALGADRAATAP